ncbi:Ubiquitin carboxyl-terminal hydrolase 35 [Lunasporangiospora selenospora]|uniref:Ubiquitin carboxyl-terminal hydrolase 35 n=1 Tax=Lunasporangiospora selenospora TaxID=979761 RepID=A0A9P6G3R8_9FUNG|nr:Ubiquitin carboxyl-terminal hydrolase 35 [Lunasporangiospora selenospora]
MCQPDNIYLTIPQVFINLSNNEQDCSIGAGFVLQILPESYTSDLDSFVLWKIRFTVQRLIDWLVQHDMPGIGVWIVSIMESLASRGEVMMLRELATQNAYKVARQLAFKERRDDAFLVLKFMLLGYHHSPILFNNIVQGLIPLLASCRKSTESLAFATEVCTLAQTLLIHFGDSDNISDKVHKARILLSLPVVTRPDALRTIQEYSWKNKTSAGFRSQPKLAQPLGKVGLVNLGNSCFMNSALRALYCTPEFKQVILSETPKVESSKVTTTRMRETFVGLSSPRLSIFNPNILYRALPEWLNDGHQQDAAEFTKVLFSLLEEESPISKKALSSFHGTVINQVKCGTCLSVSTTKEDFYDLAIPLPRSDGEELQALLDIFPSVEELNAEHHNQYYCDKCQTLRDAKRYTMLGSLPTNLIETIQVRLQDGNHGFAMYDLYAVVIHTGDSANHGHYYTYAKELPQTAEEQEKNKAPETGKLPWLLYNDTRISLSSFDSIQQTVSKSKTDTPYMLFFRKTGMAGEGRIVHPNL